MLLTAQATKAKDVLFPIETPAIFRAISVSVSSEWILLTTLETNLDAGYKAVSKAPPPTERYRQFKKLKYPRKVVTIEPVMDFDDDVFPQMDRRSEPEYVWLGLNSKPEVSYRNHHRRSFVNWSKCWCGWHKDRPKELRELDIGIPQKWRLHKSNIDCAQPPLCLQ